MMGSTLPPSSVSDALALIRLAQNPDAVAAQIEALNKACEAHAASAQALRDAEAAGMKAVDARNAELDVREGSIKGTIMALKLDQSNLDIQKVAADANDKVLADRANSLVVRERALNEARAMASADQANADQARAALIEAQAEFNADLKERTKELDLREATLAQAEADYEARVARLRQAVA